MTMHFGIFVAGVLGSLLFAEVASAPCASGVTSINVATRADAQDLSDALECTGGGVFDVTWYGNVTISQTIALGDGSTVTVSGATSVSDGTAAAVDGAGETRLFSVSDTSTLNLNDLILQGGWHDSNGSAVYAEAQSTVNAFNCEFTDNSAHSTGGAICAEDTTLDFQGTTTFTGNSAWIGGAIYAVECAIDFADTTLFLRNTAGYYGGVFSIELCDLHLGGTTYFNSTIAGGPGGGIAAEDSDVSIDGETYFTDNTAKTGGAIDCSRSNISLADEVYFVNNSAEFTGGALYASDSMVWIGGKTHFLNCTAAENGGAVHMTGSEADLNLAGETYFSFNKAVQGGAILARSQSRVNITSSTSFMNNTATSGGAVYVSEAGLTMYYYATDADDFVPGASTPTDEGRIIFEGNQASTSGGAMLVSSPTIFVVREATFSSNEALSGGGVAILPAGSFGDAETFFIGCIFENNTATNGGGLHSTAGSEAIYHSSFTRNYAGVSGGGLYHTGLTTLHNVSFVENRAGNEGMAITSIGVLDENSNATFMGNTRHCPIDEYSVERKTGGKGGTDADSCRFELVCVGCSTGCDTIPYGLSQLDDGIDRQPVCEELPSGVVPPPNGGATLETLDIREDHYRTSNKSSVVLQCHQREVCLGGTNPELYCATGYEGPYCEACAENYELGYSGCHKCLGETRRSSVGTFVAGLVVFLLVAALILMDLVQVVRDQRDEEKEGLRVWKRRLSSFRAFFVNMFPRTAIKIMVVVWQIVTQFAYIAGNVYPDVYEDFLARVSLVNLDIGRILSYSCVMHTDFYVRLVATTISPFLVLAVLCGTYVTARARNQHSDEAKRAVRDKHISAALFVAFFVYSSVSHTIFQTYACDELDNGTYLRADYSLTCTTAKHKVYMVYAAVMAGVYPIGIPVVFAWFLGRNREDLKSSGREAKAHLKPLHDLWGAYKPSRYYFEVVECGRRITLTGIAVFAFPNTAAQIAVVLLLAVIFMFLTESLAPFNKDVDMSLYRWGNAIIIASMYVALLLKVDVSSENSQSVSAFSGVLIAAHIFMVLTVVAQSIVFVEGWNSARSVVVMDRPVVRRGSSSRKLTTIAEEE